MLALDINMKVIPIVYTSIVMTVPVNLMLARMTVHQLQ